MLELEESAQGVDLYRAPGSELQFQIAAEEAEVHVDRDEVHETSILTRAQNRRAFLWSAMTGLEKAIAGPSSREGWIQRVESSLSELRQALEEHVEMAESSGGLFLEIMAVAPRLASEVELLRKEHRQLSISLARAQEVAWATEAEPSCDPSRLRRAVTSLLGRLTRHRQRGSDLVFEAYNVDIAAAD
jgi:hypothetical protein